MEQQDPNARTDVTEGLGVFLTVLADAIVKLDQAAIENRTTELFVEHIDVMMSWAVEKNPFEVSEDQLHNAALIHERFRQVIQHTASQMPPSA